MDKPQYGYWLPPNISAHGAEIDNLISVLHWFMAVLFVGWGIYLLYCLVKFRERPGHDADHTPRHFVIPKYLEIAVILVEAGILAFFSFPIWAKVKRDFPDKNDPKTVIIDVTAEQFTWTVTYPGKDGKFGKRKFELMDGTNPIGLDREDEAGKDDIISPNVLNIPVNRPVIVNLTSKDVIHSFYLPVMRVKQDTIPGMEIPIWFQATETGEFEIACAQLCGVGHTQMRGMFNVLSEEKYQSWLDEEHKSLMGDATPAVPAAETTPEAPAANGETK